MAVKTTERELAGWINGQINKILEKGGYPFKESSVEPSLPGRTSRFPDIVIWISRQASDAFAFIELKPPGKLENPDRLPVVADRLQAKYAITWNFLQAKLFYINQTLVEKKTIPTHVISDLEEWLRTDKQVQIKKYLKDFLEYLKELHDKGHLHSFAPDKFFFINLLQETTEKLQTYFSEHLQKANRNRKFKEEIEAFIVQQGLLNLNTREINALVARQWVYGLITKILFYLTIRRHFNELPDIIKEIQNVRSIDKIIKKAFTEARKLDWHAVFEEENRYEKIGIPQKCGFILKDLLKRLDEYNFGQLKEDVIGGIFESLIPKTEKHKYGQYFTREDLVDFILGFIVRSPDDYCCDPACGSGTFLNRIYSRIKWLSTNQKKHIDILPQIWGIDIARFPAELATINLFRQNISDYRNFPRVQVSDFFDVEPGHVFKFPPPKANLDRFFKTDEKIPQFDGMAGNFPFIRQEQIEKKVPDNKKKITKVISDDWYVEYPDVFKSINSNNVELKLSGQADIYAYLFFHAAKFLKQDGRMGFITSNSYLDVGYGYELKKFFLKKFKIVAVVASWAEPWFDFASVNTIFTILERCDDPKERSENTVRFVKVKKKLQELIPYPDLEFDENNRWNHIDKLVRKIELDPPPNDGVCSREDDDFRIRYVMQNILNEQIEKEGKHAKWGKYLRAPDVYFEILEKAKDYLLPLNHMKDGLDIRFGIKTGINDFFYLEPTGKKAKRTSCINVQNKCGWVGDIEKRFLKPVIKSPKEASKIIIDKKSLQFKIFMCNMSKTDLKRSGYRGTLNYINWGEQQRTKDKILWPKVSSVKSRKYWWSLGDKAPYPILMQMVNNDRFVIFFNIKKAYVDHNLFELDINSKYSEIVAALLNSSFTAINREIVSRINLGDGATKTEGVDWANNIFIFNFKIFSKTKINKILTAFSKIKERPILSIEKEVKRKDRQALDNAILEAIGLDPNEYSPKIYKGLTELVSERLALPKMRKKISKAKMEYSFDLVKNQVEDEILPDGLRIFPDSFIFERIKFKEIPISGKPMRISNHFFGRYEIIDEDGKKIYDAKGMDEANYIVCAYMPNVYIIKVPVNEKVIIKTITSYEKYIREIFQKLVRRA